jgi:hypothetical protein
MTYQRVSVLAALNPLFVTDDFQFLSLPKDASSREVLLGLDSGRVLGRG